MAIKQIEINLEYMNVIPNPPKKAPELYAQACSSDGITISTWRDIWLSNIKANHAAYGPFKDRSVGQLYSKFEKKPCIIVGSGPSLKNNYEVLKDTKGIPVISCLHNFHFMVDHEIPVDYYVSLDAGEITIKEISEGGKLTHEEYIKATKNKTLIAFIGSSPKLLETWKGKILFFNCPIPDRGLLDEINAVEEFYCYLSTGGNVLGACMYIAKAILGCNPIVFVGADFAFSYVNKFHGWDSAYDKDLGHALRTMDVYGMPVKTWQSYFNFKLFYEWVAMTVPGLYINCTEGGTLGAYPEGNIIHIMQMPLKHLIRMYSLHEDIKEQCMTPEVVNNKILY